MPEVDDEVLVAFLEGDPDRPLLGDGLFSDPHQPPPVGGPQPQAINEAFKLWQASDGAADENGDDVTDDRDFRIVLIGRLRQIGLIEDSSEDEDRVTVKVPSIDSESEGLWARIATLDGGEERGGFFTPEVADESLVDFIEGDPDRPFFPTAPSRGSTSITGRVVDVDDESTIVLESADGQRTTITVSERATLSFRTQVVAVSEFHRVGNLAPPLKGSTVVLRGNLTESGVFEASSIEVSPGLSGRIVSFDDEGIFIEHMGIETRGFYSNLSYYHGPADDSRGLLRLLSDVLGSDLSVGDNVEVFGSEDETGTFVVGLIQRTGSTRDAERISGVVVEVVDATTFVIETEDGRTESVVIITDGEVGMGRAVVDGSLVVTGSSVVVFGQRDPELGRILSGRVDIQPVATGSVRISGGTVTFVTGDEIPIRIEFKEGAVLGQNDQSIVVGLDVPLDNPFVDPTSSAGTLIVVERSTVVVFGTANQDGVISVDRLEILDPSSIFGGSGDTENDEPIVIGKIESVDPDAHILCVDADGIVVKADLAPEVEIRVIDHIGRPGQLPPGFVRPIGGTAAGKQAGPGNGPGNNQEDGTGGPLDNRGQGNSGGQSREMSVDIDFLKPGMHIELFGLEGESGRIAVSRVNVLFGGARERPFSVVALVGRSNGDRLRLSPPQSIKVHGSTTILGTDGVEIPRLEDLRHALESEFSKLVVTADLDFNAVSIHVNDFEVEPFSASGVADAIAATGLQIDPDLEQVFVITSPRKRIRLHDSTIVPDEPPEVQLTRFTQVHDTSGDAVNPVGLASGIRVEVTGICVEMNFGRGSQTLYVAETVRLVSGKPFSLEGTVSSADPGSRQVFLAAAGPQAIARNAAYRATRNQRVSPEEFRDLLEADPGLEVVIRFRATDGIIRRLEIVDPERPRNIRDDERTISGVSIALTPDGAWELIQTGTAVITAEDDWESPFASFDDMVGGRVIIEGEETAAGLVASRVREIQTLDAVEIQAVVGDYDGDGVDDGILVTVTDPSGNEIDLPIRVTIDRLPSVEIVSGDAIDGIRPGNHRIRVAVPSLPGVGAESRFVIRAQARELTLVSSDPENEMTGVDASTTGEIRLTFSDPIRSVEGFVNAVIPAARPERILS